MRDWSPHMRVEYSRSGGGEESEGKGGGKLEIGEKQREKGGRERRERKEGEKGGRERGRERREVRLDRR